MENTREDLQQRLANAEAQLEQINLRNHQVAQDKAWETSKFRIFSICLLTYIVIAAVFYIIGVENFLVNAIIPTTGFYLSTLSLPILKRCWIRYFK